MKPLFPAFNSVVCAMAKRALPRGYTVTVHEPYMRDGKPCLDLMSQDYATTGRLKVWQGASDRTIFGDPCINWAFRAWHDYCHVVGKHGFTLEGERLTATRQIRNMRAAYGYSGVARVGWDKVLWIEVVEQAEHFAATGAFPVDQRAFMLNRLAHPVFKGA